MTSSSPSPSPVRLSPVCSTEPSGLRRLLKKTKWESLRTRPFAPTSRALASRSKSAPVVDRASQPRPTMIAVRFGALLDSDTFPPLVRATPIPASSSRRWNRSRGSVNPPAHPEGWDRSLLPHLRHPAAKVAPPGYSAEHGAETKDSSGAGSQRPGKRCRYAAQPAATREGRPGPGGWRKGCCREAGEDAARAAGQADPRRVQDDAAARPEDRAVAAALPPRPARGGHPG